MNVTPPASWGKVRGTVTDAANGAPIAGCDGRDLHDVRRADR